MKQSEKGKTLDPLNKMGKVSCIICNSKMHWADHCPQKNESACNLLTENTSEREE